MKIEQVTSDLIIEGQQEYRFNLIGKKYALNFGRTTTDCSWVCAVLYSYLEIILVKLELTFRHCAYSFVF